MIVGLLMVLGLGVVVLLVLAGLAAAGKISFEHELSVGGYDVAVELSQTTPLEVSVTKKS